MNPNSSLREARELGAEKPRVVVVTLAFTPSPTALDDEMLAGRIADDLRDAGYDGHILGITVNAVPTSAEEIVRG